MARLKDDITQRIPSFITAWEEWAPGATFAGLNFEEFKTKMGPPIVVRNEIASKEKQLEGKIIERHNADETAARILEMVVNSVRGTPGFGPNCELYRAMGYIPKSERKSGLHRKPKDKITEDLPPT